MTPVGAFSEHCATSRRSVDSSTLCCQGGCWGGDNYQDFSLARQLRISEASTRRLVKPRVWRVYRKYDYFAEFFDMVGRC